MSELPIFKQKTGDDMPSFYELNLILEASRDPDTDKAIFQAGAHGAGRQTKKRAALPPDHPESLMDIGPSMKDRGFTSDYEKPEHIPMHKDAASYYADKGMEMARIIDNLIRQDDKAFPPNEFMPEDEIVRRLKMMKTNPDRGYSGGETVNMVPDDKIKATLDKMTTAPSAFKIVSFKPTREGRGYVMLKGKRDIKPEEETTTRPGRYANPAAAQKDVGIGGTHPVVKQLEQEAGAKLGIFKQEMAKAMQTGFGFPLMQACKNTFTILNQLEANPFVVPEKKAKYKELKVAMRQALDAFASKHGGEDALQRMRPQQGEQPMQARQSPPPGMPVKAPMPGPAKQAAPFAMAREWDEIYESVENNGW